MLHYILEVLIFSYILAVVFYFKTEPGAKYKRPPYHKVRSEHTQRLPRRRSNYTIHRQDMEVRKVPHWTSCPPANTSSAIWSMVASEAEARYSLVLGMSIVKTWDYSWTLPDLRLIVIIPTKVQNKSLQRLENIGWGICYIKRLDYLLFGEEKYRVIIYAYFIEKKKFSL